MAFHTLGCKLNQAESESLARRFVEAGYRVVAPESDADVLLVNTCTVTHVADRKSRHLLRTASRSHPEALVIALGCYAQRAPEELNALAGVGLVVRHDQREQLPALVSERLNGGGSGPGGQRPGHTWPRRTRALVKIQEGCRRGCAFCIVPRVRGPETSVPAERVVSQIRALVAEGQREVVLTGTRIGAYAHNGADLRLLVRQVLAETGLERLRLTSLEPQDLSDPFLELWRDQRLCPHVHLALQSGSDAVLARMGRGYTSAEFAGALSRARRHIPDLAVSTDIMVGFPGETAEEFVESQRFCEEMGFSQLHVFPYSPRAGTRAASLPGQVPARETARRKQAMLEVARRTAHRFREQFLGRRLPVLIEQKRGDGLWTGLSDNYLRVLVESENALQGQIVTVDISDEQDQALCGALDEHRVTPKGEC